MKLGEDIAFDKKIMNLKKNEKKILALQYTLQKPTLFLNENQLIYLKMCLVHARPLWETNTNAQFILDLYARTVYCTSYLTKIYKFVTQEMQSMLNNCKYKQTKALKHIKELVNEFLNASQTSIQ